MGKPSRIWLYALLVAGLIGVVGLGVLRVYVIKQMEKGMVLQQRLMALEQGRATLQEVRDFVKQYGSPDDYVDGCDTSECHVSIALFVFRAHYRLDTRLLRTLGIRPASYGAVVDVIDGVVSREAFYVSYRTSAGGGCQLAVMLLMSSALLIVVRTQDFVATQNTLWFRPRFRPFWALTFRRA